MALIEVGLTPSDQGNAANIAHFHRAGSRYCPAALGRGPAFPPWRRFCLPSKCPATGSSRTVLARGAGQARAFHSSTSPPHNRMLTNFFG
jgi:hypothetical protein